MQSSMNPIGGYKDKHGLWIRIGDLMFRDTGLGYRLPVYVIAASSNGAQTFVLVEREGTTNRDVEMQPRDRLSCAETT